MNARIERTGLPDVSALRRALGELEGVFGGDVHLVDGDAQGPTGVDLILADGRGRPILVDIVTDDARLVPARLFEHLEWLERNRRLFLRAYSGDGVVNAETPLFLFVGGVWPKSVVRALAAVRGAEVRVFRAEQLLVNGRPELLLEEVSAYAASEPSAAVTRRRQELNGGDGSGVEQRIEKDSVRTLLALFRSGVDGLDGRIVEREKDGGLVFELGETVLAGVAVSSGSFTVSPGDPVANPVVVSDRVSLERALNAVVSLFVRERHFAHTAPPAEAPVEVAVEAEEARELERIWGDGIPLVEKR